MWEGKESSRQDRAMMMRGSQSHRDEARDADEFWGAWNNVEQILGL